KRDARTTSNALMTFSRDGKLLAVGSDAIVRVWRVADAKPVFTLALKDSAAVARESAGLPKNPGYTLPAPPSFYGVIQHLVFNRTGTMLATTNLFSSIVWSMKTGRKLAEFERGYDFRSKLLFVGDGLLMTADSGRMVIRPYLGAAPVIRPGTRAKATEYAVMSPDERWIALNGWGDTVFLWSVAESGPGRALPVPGSSPGAIAFSPDGNTVATGGGFNGLYLWNTRTGAPIKSFHNFPGPLSHLWFSPDGKSIVTFSTFDDRFRIIYVDSALRAAARARGNLYDSSLTVKLPLGLPPSNAPRTVRGVVASPDTRAVAGAEVTIANGDAPDSVIARTTTSPGGYFSFPGIRFRHIILRAYKAGFENGVRYVHLPSWDDIGPWGIELRPITRPADSAGVELH
ncbi:MAG: carboxypeptidase regulatory-like domain-containing protein, partial [bacterium]